MPDLPLTADPYAVLEVDRTAERSVIRAAYRSLAWKWHPDRGASPERMVAINAAWHILGNPTRRAAYDAAAASAANAAAAPRAGASAVTGQPGSAQGPRQATERRPSATVLDFGRYAGWTIAALVNEDPDYLAWLARTPVGRRLATEIDAALAERQRQAASLAPKPARKGRGLFGASWAGAR